MSKALRRRIKKPSYVAAGMPSGPARGHRLSREVYLSSPGRTTATPEYGIATKISEALDPTRAPGRVRTMADMTPEELAALVPPKSRR